MTFTVSALDVHYLIKEIKPLVQDAFVDKIYQSGQDMLIRMRSPQHGKQQLYLKVPEAIFLTEHRFPWPKIPPGFCMQLRKHLSNTKLIEIKQHEFERIVILKFQKGETIWTVIVELFSKGNIALVNQENLIRGVLSLQRWKDRTLRVNTEFIFPPAKKNTKTISEEELSELFKEENKPLVKFCATTLSLGGKYAEELVERTKLGKDKKQLSKEEITTLHKSLQEIFNEQIKPEINKEDISPFNIKGGKTAPSFSEGVEELVVKEKIMKIDSETDTAFTSQQGKYDKIIKAQEANLKKYKKQIDDNQKRGELIYEKYQDLSKLFSTLQELHKKDGWKAVKKFIKENEFPITANEKQGTIELEMK